MESAEFNSARNIFFGKTWSKTSKLSVLGEIWYWANSTMQGIFQYTLFWTNLIQKIKIFNFSWNFLSILIRICTIQWRCSLFFLLAQKYLFWENLIQKIVSLSWNLVRRLIQIYGIFSVVFAFSVLNQKYHLLPLSYFDWKYPFWGKICSKKSKLFSKAKLIRICRIRWWIAFFLFLDWKYHFWVNLVQKLKIFSLC